MTKTFKDIDDALNCLLAGGGSYVITIEEGLGHFYVQHRWRKCAQKECAHCDKMKSRFKTSAM
jgi:hypothetical protein